MKKEVLLKTSIRYGVFIFLSLISYFFIMKAFNLIQYQELRGLNWFFIFVIVAIALSKMKKLMGGKLNYFNGIGWGLMTTLFGMVPFCFFILFYLLADASFLGELQQRSSFGNMINPSSGALFNLIEGMAAGLISSFIVMPYYKTSTLEQMNRRPSIGKRVRTSES